MAGDIVPIELGLTDGDVVTLWAPRWREGDDEWQAFLGREDDLFVFDSIANLAAFIRTEDDHDLAEHPTWHVVAALSAAELEPDEEHRYDLVGVPELAAGAPEPLTVAELEDTLNMARTLGEVCDLDAVNAFFDNHPQLEALPGGHHAFAGSDGIELWNKVGMALADGWDDVLDAIDGIIESPEVDADVLALCEAEILAADENDVEADDAAESADDVEVIDAKPTASSDDEDSGEDDFWTSVGIDPVKILLGADEYYTLRCYIDDIPVFLGKEGVIYVFRSDRSLARYLADAHDHELASVSTYGEVATAATDGSLDITVTDDNTYVLTGLFEDIAEGPESVDSEQLDLAVELLTDAADFADDDSVEEALASTTPLGWYTSYVTNPDPTRMAPSPPFASEAAAWLDLVRAFEGRLRVR
ncbi:primosomal protein [Hoyosella sp. YIM 151337]|uniref:primosomal protein n=1 Tax=Hoyosella sp. YIM 151337 TaxID=2992742 RepID=UPI0022363424|nr:primosomal protein [Hoyosella sp. YIM 151337]MCW4352373.1 primosomal protein [Hoyosella sp. YIM 151337]